MIRKGKKRKAQKAGLNKSILNRFATLNKMITAKLIAQDRLWQL